MIAATGFWADELDALGGVAGAAILVVVVVLCSYDSYRYQRRLRAVGLDPRAARGRSVTGGAAGACGALAAVVVPRGDWRAAALVAVLIAAWIAGRLPYRTTLLHLESSGEMASQPPQAALGGGSSTATDRWDRVGRRVAFALAVPLSLIPAIILLVGLVELTDLLPIGDRTAQVVGSVGAIAIGILVFWSLRVLRRRL